jgi:hypothetical protein
MQGLWYGDRRDRVKWGALAHLVDRFDLASILQVAYFRDGAERLLKTDLGEYPIADEVWKHFADLAAIERLSKALGVEIRVHGEAFDSRKREEYIVGVLSAAGQRPRPRLLFLDPDTGIEPGSLKPEHVSTREIARLWTALDLGEVLAVYQHAPHETAWVDQSVQHMAKACPGADVRSIQGSVAKDVAILWARKEHVSSV